MGVSAGHEEEVQGARPKIASKTTGFKLQSMSSMQRLFVELQDGFIDSLVRPRTVHPSFALASASDHHLTLFDITSATRRARLYQCSTFDYHLFETWLASKAILTIFDVVQRLRDRASSSRVAAVRR